MSQNPNKTFWAFISYSSLDKKWGAWMHKKLENYPIPSDFQGEELFDGAVLGKNLRPIFRDRDELSGSAELGPAIMEALEKSRFLIVLCSKNSAKSEWVNKEIEDFKTLKQGNDQRILALIIDGEPNATSSNKSDSAEECFPPALRYPLEPLAGDLRKEGDGKERGFLKVLAGITQLSFDKLYRRHERAQQKKRLLLGITAVTIIALLSFLTVFALNQKKEATTQRDLAQQNETIAQKQTALAETRLLESEKARNDAETAIGYLMNEARASLSEAGRIDILKNLNIIIIEYLKENPNGADTLRARQQVAFLLDQALQYQRLGNHSQSIKLCQQALDHLKQEHPTADNEEIAKLYIEVYIRISESKSYGGDMTGAKDSVASIEDYIKLIDLEKPSDSTVNLLIGYYSHKSRLQFHANERNAALETLQLVIDRFSETESQDTIFNIGLTLNRKFNIEWELKKYPQAKVSAEDLLTLSHKLINPFTMRDIQIRAYFNSGKYQSHVQNYKEAIRLYRKCIESCKHASILNPTYADAPLMQARALAEIGYISRNRKQYAQAAEAFNEAMTLMLQVSGTDRTNAAYIVDYMNSVVDACEIVTLAPNSIKSTKAELLHTLESELKLLKILSPVQHKKDIERFQRLINNLKS